jgi:plasmid stabilization system protein ParE
MTARYRVFLTAKARANNSEIQAYLARVRGPETADAWEDQFENVFLIALSKVPHLQIVRPATNTNPIEVRRAVYRPRKKGAGYYVFYTIEEFVRPNPEPTTDFLAGAVYIVAIRPASMEPLTDEEINSL